MNRNHVIFGGVLAAGLAIGGVGGYLLAAHRLQRLFDREVEEVRSHYRSRTAELERVMAFERFDVAPKLRPVGGRRELDADAGDAGAGNMSVPYPLARRAGQVPAELGLADDDYEPTAARSLGTDVEESGGSEADDLDDDESEAYGSGDDAGDEDGSAESDGGEPDPRGPGPYVISESEFYETHNHDYTKVSCIFYQGDRILADQQDAPIRDLRGTVGTNDLGSLFGQEGAADPNIVHIRNDRLQVDFEVALNYTKFVETVLGYGTPNPKPLHILPDGV